MRLLNLHGEGVKATAMKLATLCYLKKGGKILMLHRNRDSRDIHYGKWNGLGGKFELGENPEECVTREVLEESGLLIKRPELRGVLTFPRFKDEEDWYAFVFVATEFSGEISSSQEGELHWIAEEQVPQLELWEGDHYFLSWLQSDRFFSGTFVYKDGKLLQHSVVFYPHSQV